MIGDTKVPSDSVLKPLLEEAMLYIANNAHVLGLVTRSKDFTLLRKLNDGYYMRRPTMPSSDGETLDMDHELCFAVANIVAAHLSKRKTEFFMLEAEEIVNQYNFKVYNASDQLEAEDAT